MYLRHSTVRKNGKVHTYWRLVRSVRIKGKVIQQTVAQLGELDSDGRAKAKTLARELMGEREQLTLFEEASSNETVPVKLTEVRLERSRGFGDVWIGLQLWRMLKLDSFFDEHLRVGHEHVPWASMAAILVVARLCEPSSELHIAEDWYRKTALGDLLGVPDDKVNDDRLYRALDAILPHKAKLEKHLRQRLGELFELQYDLLLYDVTSTYFEGKAEANPQARRGHSRDHRPDCKQVCIALVVTREGMPLGYEIFAGNRVDVTTVEDIVATMEARHGKANRIWVMDRGMTSEDNVAWFHQTNRQYILGASKIELKKWAPRLTDKRDWKQVRDGVEAKLCPGPDGKETFVLIRSLDRQAKEAAMHERFSKHIEEGLSSLNRRIENSKKPLKRGSLERQVGRLLQRNSRAAGKYAIEFVDDASIPAGVRLTWSIESEWAEWAKHSEGAYVLRTNVNDWSSEDLWKTYIQLTDAESAFRIHKSELSLRPVWHQLEHRVQAHILVCFLAYVLWKTLEQWQKRAGLGNSPRTILDELTRIQCSDVVLPIADSKHREIRLRCVARPDKAQAALLDRLGLELPQRLRRSPNL